MKISIKSVRPAAAPDQQVAKQLKVNSALQRLVDRSPKMVAQRQRVQSLSTREHTNSNATTTSKNVIQRYIIHDPDALGTDVYFSGYEEGEPVNDLQTLMGSILREQPALAKHENQINDFLNEHTGKGKDLVYDNLPSLVEYLTDKLGLNATSSSPKTDGSYREKKGVGGITIGKLSFEGDDYHRIVKPTVQTAIGKKALQKILKQKDATNSDFWFDTDGTIYVAPNNQGAKKPPEKNNTGYRLNMNGYKVVEIEP